MTWAWGKASGSCFANRSGDGARGRDLDVRDPRDPRDPRDAVDRGCVFEVAETTNLSWSEVTPSERDDGVERVGGRDERG